MLEGEYYDSDDDYSVYLNKWMVEWMINAYTPIPQFVVPTESNKQEAVDRKGHWNFLLIHLFIRRHFDNMHFQMAE